jgi:hypothetical protein
MATTDQTGSSVTVHDDLPEEDRVPDYPPPTVSG